MAQKTFYITTAIYYANSNLHIGHSYEIVLADAMARYKKLRGYDVKFLTGMDEHGQKVERAAAADGVGPQEYVDKIADATKNLFCNVLNIDYDIFIRTTDEKHKAAVRKIFNKLYEKGDIYKSDYEGLYCIPCEAFYTEHQLKAGKCPECDRSVEPVKESSYFFKLSKYQDRLIEHIESNPDFIQPKSRQNEMLNNFLRPGLEDLCVTRTTFKWGVPVDFDSEHVTYVWVDALTNYISALDYLTDNPATYTQYWPADIQLVGKDVVRFHTIIWPALLMALDEPLPKQVFGHGFLNIDGKKMGKSVGNVVDPRVLVNRYGTDAIRYFLMREVAHGQDGNFSNETLIGRINADLANDLGNLLSRTVGMIDKYFGGELPTAQTTVTEFDQSLMKVAAQTVKRTEELYDNMQFSDALGEIWNFVRRANKYIDEVMPWALFKEGGKENVLARCLYVLAESLRIIAILISPVMPNTPLAVYAQLNIGDESIKTWDSTKEFGLLAKEVTITKGDIVFPRIDIKKELEELADL